VGLQHDLQHGEQPDVPDEGQNFTQQTIETITAISTGTPTPTPTPIAIGTK